MGKDNKKHEEQIENLEATENTEKSCCDKGEKKNDKHKCCGHHSKEHSKDHDKTKELETKLNETTERLTRIAADFDNFKRRTSKEKETVYLDALGEAVVPFLPVLDNFERAIKALDTSNIDEAIKSGFEMLYRQFNEAVEKVGVKPIISVGEKFDPELHNAVMHIDDESYSEAEIIEEFQKGFKIGEKVIRHSMVKVAN